MPCILHNGCNPDAYIENNVQSATEVAELVQILNILVLRSHNEGVRIDSHQNVAVPVQGSDGFEENADSGVHKYIKKCPQGTRFD